MPRYTYFFALALATSTACHPNDVDQVQLARLARANSAIVNGTRDPQVIDLSAQQIMAIGWLYERSNPSQAFCTATLVAPRYIVTAEHCTNGQRASAIGFGMGLEPSAPEALIDAAAIFPNRELDASIIELAQDATTLGIDVVPVTINQAEIASTSVGRAVQAGGFGETRDSSRSGRWFATVFIDRIQSTEVVVDGRGEQGICYGDSGSALIDLDGQGEPVVLAVESWGDSSCVDIDHMTRLDAIYPWVTAVLSGEEPQDPCEQIPPGGRCDNNVAQWCIQGSYHNLDCTAQASTCAFIENASAYGCTCGDLDEVGRCDGDVIEFCRYDSIVRWDCAESGSHCAYIDSSGRYNCSMSPSCRAEDINGRCQGDVLVRCSDAVTTREVCALDGKVCAVVAGQGACVDPGTVLPDAGVADASSTAKETPTGCGCSTHDTPDSVLLLLVGLLFILPKRTKFL